MTVLNAAGLDPLKSWTWCVLSLVWGTALQTRDAGGCGVTPGVDVGLLPPTLSPPARTWGSCPHPLAEERPLAQHKHSNSTAETPAGTSRPRAAGSPPRAWCKCE